MTFDPNAPEADPRHRWASYSDTRTRNKGFKTHSTFAHLRSAIGSCRAIACYERVDNKWVTIYEHGYREGGPKYIGTDGECYVCKAPFPYKWTSWSGTEPFTKMTICFNSKCHSKLKLGVYKPPVEPLDPKDYRLIS